MHNWKLVFVYLVGTIVTSTTYADVRQEAVERVNKAVEVLAQQGPAALELIGQQNGPYHQGENYVFVYDRDVVIRAHPAKPVLVGRSYAGKPDVKGFKFRDAIVQNTLKDGESWTDYHYQKPGESGVHEKTTYCKKAAAEEQTLVVCSGVYAGK